MLRMVGLVNCLVLLAGAAATAGAAEISGAGEIYCNAQGRECSDRPTATSTVARSLPKRTATGNSSPAAGAAVVVPATPTASAADRVAQQRQENEELAKAQKELQQDFTTKRAEQCKLAKDYYTRSVAATVLYKTDKDGKRQTLNEADSNQERLNAKMQMDKVCAQAR
jgi:hypothetical protein